MVACPAATGATGLVGSRLVARLAAQGHAVRVLTRNVGAARAKLPYGRLQFYGPTEWAAAINGATGVVNLAGKPDSLQRSTRFRRALHASRNAAEAGVCSGFSSGATPHCTAVLHTATTDDRVTGHHPDQRRQWLCGGPQHMQSTSAKCQC